MSDDSRSAPLLPNESEVKPAYASRTNWAALVLILATMFAPKLSTFFQTNPDVLPVVFQVLAYVASLSMIVFRHITKAPVMGVIDSVSHLFRKR